MQIRTKNELYRVIFYLIRYIMHSTDYKKNPSYSGKTIKLPGLFLVNLKFNICI